MLDPASAPLFRFGPYEVDFRSGELRKNGHKIRIQEQPFQVLAILLAQPGQMVTREELRQRLWRDQTFVDFDHGLNTAIRKVREALEDSADNPRFVETLAKHGYRFVAPVEHGTAHACEAEIRSIAVLPLENLSGDPGQEYFADALTEELITNLGRAGGLRVISRTSVMRFKGARKALPEIARELNVDAMVEGTVRRLGDRVRVTANLIHAVTDQHLWAEAYERDLKDTLAVQSDVTSAIADGIRSKLTIQPVGRREEATHRPIKPEAYEAYSKGRYYAQRYTVEGFKKSNEYLVKAIDAGPEFAPAYAALAENCVQASLALGQRHNELYARGRQSAQRALELDPLLAEAHAALANLVFHFDWDWALAEREFQRALQLNPNLVAAHQSYAEFLMRMGRGDESIAEYKYAQLLDPLSLMVNTQLGWAYGTARRYEQAIVQFRQVLEMAPNFPVANHSLGVAYEMSGRHDEAIRALRTALDADKGNWVFLTYLAFACGRANKRSKALEMLAQLQTRSENENVSPFAFAIVRLGLGQHDEVFSFLEKAHQDRDAWMITLKASPEFDPLRPHPRFQDLLRRMNFPP